MNESNKIISLRAVFPEGEIVFQDFFEGKKICWFGFIAKPFLINRFALPETRTQTTTLYSGTRA